MSSKTRRCWPLLILVKGRPDSFKWFCLLQDALSVFSTSSLRISILAVVLVLVTLSVHHRFLRLDAIGRQVLPSHVTACCIAQGSGGGRGRDRERPAQVMDEGVTVAGEESG